MGATIRFGISLDSDLLTDFDMLCKQRSYANRSEAIRDLLRQTLAEESLTHADQLCVGTLSLVYNHHHADMARRLTAIQHEAHDIVIASLHVHLDHHHCLEVLVLEGKASAVRCMAEQLVSIKGVQHGDFTLTPKPEAHEQP